MRLPGPGKCSFDFLNLSPVLAQADMASHQVCIEVLVSRVRSMAVCRVHLLRADSLRTATITDKDVCCQRLQCIGASNQRNLWESSTCATVEPFSLQRV